MMIWDIREGKLSNEFIEAGRAPLSMEWLRRHEVSNDLMLILFSPNMLVLVNADTGVRLWKKSFNENVMSLAVDPFDGSHMTSE